MKSQFTSYTESWIPKPYTIFGLNMMEYSLGHYILMSRFGCFDTGGIIEFLLSIAICSSTYQEFINFIRDPEEMERWFKNFFNQIEEALKDPSFTIALRKNLFDKYMNESIQIPAFFQEKEEDIEKQTGAHWTQNVIKALTMESSRYSEKELLDLPLSKVLADYFKVAEDKGYLTLMRDDELEQIEFLEKQKKEECKTAEPPDITPFLGLI